MIYENKYCTISSPENMPGVYVVRSKTGKYPDQYFTSLNKAYKSIGINMFNHNFKQKIK